jgi:hypothetical protein
MMFDIPCFTSANLRCGAAQRVFTIAAVPLFKALNRHRSVQAGGLANADVTTNVASANWRAPSVDSCGRTVEAHCGMRRAGIYIIALGFAKDAQPTSSLCNTFEVDNGLWQADSFISVEPASRPACFHLETSWWKPAQMMLPVWA